MNYDCLTYLILMKTRSKRVIKTAPYGWENLKPQHIAGPIRTHISEIANTVQRLQWLTNHNQVYP